MDDANNTLFRPQTPPPPYSPPQACYEVQTTTGRPAVYLPSGHPRAAGVAQKTIYPASIAVKPLGYTTDLHRRPTQRNQNATRQSVVPSGFPAMRLLSEREAVGGRRNRVAFDDDDGDDDDEDQDEVSSQGSWQSYGSSSSRSSTDTWNDDDGDNGSGDLDRRIRDLEARIRHLESELSARDGVVDALRRELKQQKQRQKRRVGGGGDARTGRR